jgi:hypothetical protein
VDLDPLYFRMTAAHVTDATYVLALAGEIDLAQAAELDDELKSLVDEGDEAHHRRPARGAVPRVERARRAPQVLADAAGERRRADARHGRRARVAL